MSFGIGKPICGLLLGIAAITAVQGADFPKWEQAVPKGGNTTKYAPVFDFDLDSCYPAVGFSRDGIANPGEDASHSFTGGCRHSDFVVPDKSRTEYSNTLHRYACVTEDADTYCAHNHSLYFEKDQAVMGSIFAGHRHDWEYVIVWTTNGLLTHVSASAHGQAVTLPHEDILLSGTHPMIVYHKSGGSTHAFRFADNTDKAEPENITGEFVTPTIISWYEMTSDSLSNKQMRDRLNDINQICYNCCCAGGGTIPVIDRGNVFLNDLNNNRPKEVCIVTEPDCIPSPPGGFLGFRYFYPEFTQASVEAANPHKPVLLFVEGDGTFSGEGAEYFLDFGQVPEGRRRLSANLAFMNDVDEPADNLDVDFDTAATAPYLCTGCDNFAGLAAGDSSEVFIVELPTAGHGPGVVTGEIVMAANGLVDTGWRPTTYPITLTMSLEIVPAADDGGRDDDCDDDDNIFGCTIGPYLKRGGLDPTLIFMIVIAFIYIGMRYRRARRIRQRKARH